MQNNDGGGSDGGGRRRSVTAPAQGHRRKSVEFATIVEVEEEETNFTRLDSQQSGLSDASITLDDLDPRAVQKKRASVEINDDIIHRSLTIQHQQPSNSKREMSGMSAITDVTSHQSNYNSGQISQQSSSKQSGVVSAIVRRFAGSRFSSLQSDYHTQESTQQEEEEYNNNAYTRSNMPRRAPMVGVPNSNNRDRGDGENRRATIMTRNLRRSIATRSSITTSASRMSDDERRDTSYCLSDSKIHTLRFIINHPMWKGMTLFFILILLFGPPIDDIWLPKEADLYVDIMLSIAFVVLAIDIMIRCVVDKSYFAWDREGNYWGRRDKCCHHRNSCVNVHAGSFMFWFDTIALLTVLYKISYVNPAMQRPQYTRVDLSEFGFPIAGGHSTPFHMNVNLILTVGRVGLMARFIRTSFLVQVTSLVPMLRLFHPGYYIQKLTSRCRDKREEKQKNLASQRVLASSSRARNHVSRDSDMISQLGDSRRLSRSSASRRSMRFSKTEGNLEPHEEVDSEESDPSEDAKPVSIREYLKGLTKRSSDKDSLDGGQPESLLLGNTDSKDSGSHVGAAMRELTGQRIATGVLLALLLTVICTWAEPDTTKAMTMLTLHTQTANLNFANMSLDVARASVIPTLYNYTRANSTGIIFHHYYELTNDRVRDLREREILSVDVYKEGSDVYTSGQFNNSPAVIDSARVELVTTILLLIVWILGVASFAGPVMTLVVEPIERMVRLLSMLMKDPLGYQNSQQYRKLKKEEDEAAAVSMWPKDALKGMETNFLMSTIRRIGALMQVGFGSAGVEIIRNNLERGQHKDILFLNKQGTSVSCIFLFCDIRQFTDATESLQEEVFVFTNKIAAVIHSICANNGGSANKNIGDAFLLSWRLDDAPEEKEEDEDDPFSSYVNSLNLNRPQLYARDNQADKALLSVVKISMALHYDKYFTDGMNEEAKNRLLTKLSKRKGPLVQMGFGLHAGKAVQGAIGSQRKLDATYISESVERAEFLESSTKKYGVPLLMTDSFYDLLEPSNKYRCRKIDQLIMLSEDEGGLTDPNELLDSGEKVNLYTFDMDIDALWRAPADDDNNSTTNSNNEIEMRRTLDGPGRSNVSLKRSSLQRRASFTAFADIPTSLNRSSRRGSAFIPNDKKSSKEMREVMQAAAAAEDKVDRPVLPKTLVLPTGVHRYTDRDWLEPDIKKIRRDYQEGLIFPKFQEGLKSYYSKDWERAKACFEFVLTQREDGPSKYFLGLMAEHGGVPPRNFLGYSVVRG